MRNPPKPYSPISFPLLASKFRVCAMDRRAHGASGDTLPYGLQKEVEDVVATKVLVNPHKSSEMTGQ